jgi:alpha-mannosidase
VRSCLQFVLRIGQSTITQKVALPATSKRLDFFTTVDWREKHQMLRVAFPVDVHVESASFDIQYGYTTRPTHRNTEWDISRFEVCAHKWVDMSDAGYGVALLNNCKYGHKLFNNVIDLCVLRSPTWPDPDADTGVHELRYAFYPHAGTLTQTDVQRQGFNVNQLPVQFESMTGGDLQVPVQLDSDDVHLAVLKKAEKENCWIVRLVEQKGKYSKAQLKIPATTALHVCGLMEWDEGAALKHTGQVDLTLKPFEIRTFKLKR